MRGPDVWLLLREFQLDPSFVSVVEALAWLTPRSCKGYAASVPKLRIVFP